MSSDTTGPPAEWFREWFGDAYLSLYPHRDEEEARAAVRLFVAAARPKPEGRVLDLACGAGRHLAHLERAGFAAIGIDLSAPLLREARRLIGPAARLVRGDMRQLPFHDGSFDAVASFFTSFGYFVSEAEDRKVAGEIRRVLRPGGVFLLDYLNAAHVRDTLVLTDESRIGERIVRQTRWLEGGSVVKRIEISSPDGGGPAIYHERVRMYEPADLTRLLEAHGLTTRERFGSYRGEPHADSSPRLLLVGVAR